MIVYNVNLYEAASLDTLCVCVSLCSVYRQSRTIKYYSFVQIIKKFIPQQNVKKRTSALNNNSVTGLNILL